MENPNIILTPLKNGVPAQGGAIDVLVRIQAPDQPVDEVPFTVRKHLAVVLDRSSSMQGKPLKEALRCVQYIAKQLSPTDQLALITYDTYVNKVFPLQPVSEEALAEAINKVYPGGCTDLHAGWVAGVAALRGQHSDTVISRVILLSDGKANRGITYLPELAHQCIQALAGGISTTTIGLGRSFDEELMLGMAKAGDGKAYYGKQAEDIFDGFCEEVALLNAMYMPKFNLRFMTAPGVILEMRSLVKVESNGTYPLSGLAWGSESWLAVRLHLSPSVSGSVRDLFSVSLDGVTPNALKLEAHTGVSQLPVVDSAVFAELPSDPLAEQRFKELQFSESIDEVRRLVERGDKVRAKNIFRDLKDSLRDNVWLSSKVDYMDRMIDEDEIAMIKEARFSSYRTRSRLAAKFEPTSFCSMADLNGDMPSFLRRKVAEGEGIHENLDLDLDGE